MREPLLRARTHASAAKALADDEVRHQAGTDALTLPNRRSFDAALAVEWSRVMRDSMTRSAVLMMIDVDRFKQYNDRYGHLMGTTACMPWRPA